MNVKSIERKGNETTIVVEIEKDLMEACVDQIDELEKALARAEERVMQVKNAVRCSACGACNANNAAYCNQCGEKLD